MCMDARVIRCILLQAMPMKPSHGYLDQCAGLIFRFVLLVRREYQGEGVLVEYTEFSDNEYGKMLKHLL